MSNQMVFLGGGNMAEALLHGILAAGDRRPEEITVTDVRLDRLAELSARFGVRVTGDNAEAVRGASEIWLCVKPQQMDELLAPLAGLAPTALFISIAAGVLTRRIEAALGGKARVVRVMPNTPALVGEGAAGVAAGSFATPDDVRRVVKLMSAVGGAVIVEEEALHAVTAVSGSGPAYVFYLVEAMLAAAGELGLDPVAARDLVVRTVIGAGRLLAASGESPEVLRARVTSKGGTTAAAIAAFDAAGVSAGLRQGVMAAAARSRELAGGK